MSKKIEAPQFEMKRIFCVKCGGFIHERHIRSGTEIEDTHQNLDKCITYLGSSIVDLEAQFEQYIIKANEKIDSLVEKVKTLTDGRTDKKSTKESGDKNG